MVTWRLITAERTWYIMPGSEIIIPYGDDRNQTSQCLAYTSCTSVIREHQRSVGLWSLFFFFFESVAMQSASYASFLFPRLPLRIVKISARLAIVRGNLISPRWLTTLLWKPCAHYAALCWVFFLFFFLFRMILKVECSPLFHKQCCYCGSQILLNKTVY